MEYFTAGSNFSNRRGSCTGTMHFQVQVPRVLSSTFIQELNLDLTLVNLDLTFGSISKFRSHFNVINLDLRNIRSPDEMNNL